MLVPWSLSENRSGKIKTSGKPLIIFPYRHTEFVHVLFRQFFFNSKFQHTSTRLEGQGRLNCVGNQTIWIIRPVTIDDPVRAYQPFRKRCIWEKQIFWCWALLGQSIGCRAHFKLIRNDLGCSQDFVKGRGRGHNPPNFHPVTSIILFLIGCCRFILRT